MQGYLTIVASPNVLSSDTVWLSRMPIYIQGDASFKEYSLYVACLASFDWVEFGDHASIDK